MNKSFVTLSLLCLIQLHVIAQEEDSTSNAFMKRIFLPSIDVGYLTHNSDILSGALKIATSIEYRIKNNNDFFVRLNYDTYGTRYRLASSNNTSNAVEGTAQMTDFTIGPGYREGDNTFRYLMGIFGGIKRYEYPTATLENETILISQDGKFTFTTSIQFGAEYYFDEKSALTLSIYQNQVWKNIDFWKNGRVAYGFSVGFITSLM